MAFDKELLFKESLPEADVEIVGKGTMRVRALTRAEAMSCQNVKDGDGRVAAIERKMLALAIVGFNGEPGSLTEAEIGRWQKASAAGEMEPVGRMVQELSGMTEGAAKEAYQEFGADPDAEFRLPPG